MGKPDPLVQASKNLKNAIEGLKDAVTKLATDAMNGPVPALATHEVGENAGELAQELRYLKDNLATLETNATWDGAGELAKKIRGLEGGVKSNKEGTEHELIARMQDVGNTVADLVNGAKGEAIAAEAERDNTEKATSKAQATKAAREAETHQVKAEEQAKWSELVERALGLTARVVRDAAGKSNAEILKAMAAVGAATARQYAVRAGQSANGAKKIADTA